MIPEQIEMLAEFDAEAAKDVPYPGGHEGRGVVICAGGLRYMLGAWVCVNMLRRAGCILPIELWHLGPGELLDAPDLIPALRGLNAEFIDAHEVRKSHPFAGRLNGWELKPYAVAHSQFAEVLYLDADNVPLRDPTFLFQSAEYQATGAIFWPDRGRITPTNPIWELTGVPYRDEPEVESGQIVIDKARCWRPLSLTLWMNERSEYWYRYIHGDKETWHMAWRKLAAPYAIGGHLPDAAGCFMQCDFGGRLLFQHRTYAKQDPWIESPHAGGIQAEAEVQELAALFREIIWGGRDMNLMRYERRVYSQNGEDGVLDKLFELLGEGNKYYVEIGSNMVLGDNSRHLRIDKGWWGLLLDAQWHEPALNLHKEWITAENICALLEKYDVPKEPDLLSIDVDYNDWHILRAILAGSYKPRVLVLEYNATWPPPDDRVVRYASRGGWDGTNYFGASLEAFAFLGQNFGYTLVYCEQMGVNAFFVRDDALAGAGQQPRYAGNVAKIFRPPHYGGGPNNGHPADPHNRPWTSAKEILK